MRIDKNSSDRLDKFMYLGMTLTNQNSIDEENKSILKSVNVCCNSALNVCPAVCYPTTQTVTYTEL
jgi:hypothetical protein